VRPQETTPVTIREVARRSGVSIATVSRVLNNVPGTVRDELQRRVRKAAQELDYRPNALARSLHQRRTHTIGLIITDIANPYYAGITRGIEAVSRKHGYALFFCNTDGRPSALAYYIDALRDNRVDAIIIGGGGTASRQQFQALHDRRIVAVLIGRYNVPLPAVRIDNVTGGWQAASHLLQLGHRRIAVLAVPTTSTGMRDRLRGICRAMAEQRIAFRKELLVRCGLPLASALQGAMLLMSKTPRPTAIIAANDQMAITAMHGVEKFGLRVPEDVSIVGFDNIELASYVRPALTTMGVPLYDIGVAAAETAIGLLTGMPVSKQTWLAPELIIRASTTRPPAAQP